MEFVLLERSLVFLTVLEELGPLSIEHSVVPRTFILFVAALSEKGSIAALDPVSELAFIPASIRPPEGSPAISFALHELSFI